MNINPVQIWHSGQMKQATIFSLKIVNDNLIDNAQFYYQLIEDGTNLELANGNLGISGQDYANWSGSNSAIFSWAAGVLNLTLVTP